MFLVTVPFLPYHKSPVCTYHPNQADFLSLCRQTRELLLLPQLHITSLPPPDRPRRQDRRPHHPAGGQQEIPRRGRDLR